MATKNIMSSWKNTSTLFILIFSFVKCEQNVFPEAPEGITSEVQISDPSDCALLQPVENGHVIFKDYMGRAAAFISCNKNFTLIGKSLVFTECIDGDWKFSFDESFPKCEKKCPPPPYLEHGDLDLEKKLDDVYSPTGTYLDGTVATYTCNKGYILEPSSSSIRVCRKGLWTGTDAFCKPTREINCGSPPGIENGYMQPSFFIEYTDVPVGQEVLYQCLHGYKLVGSHKIKCTELGLWSPEAPLCHKDTDFLPTSECASRPLLDPKLHAKVEISSVTTNAVEVSCQGDYQNILAPCQSSKFYCKHGKWVGVYPRCVEDHVCRSPPAIPYAVAVNSNFESSYNSDGVVFFPYNAQVRYECLKGYELDGSATLTCHKNGCWEPVDFWPSCVRAKDSYYSIELNNINAILISSATGAGVLGILLLACLIVACKKRKALARAVSLPPSTTGSTRHSSDVVNDHTVLLQHPDRLALIAFAEGVQNNPNNALPSYDEATRDRSTLIQVSRLQIQRPHWPNLATCRTSGRNRGSPIIDSGHHVARHGSFASHTPSMRSGGESMGSTETVTISEGSTNVTLDTASSHSAVSQNPSCRGHCGSLASFDGCSTANTEGIPLLEESELEEAQGSSNDAENPVASDNVSSKISNHSAPMLTNNN